MRSFRFPRRGCRRPLRRERHQIELERLEDRLNLAPNWEPAVALTPNAQINGDFLQADGPMLHFAYVTGGHLFYRRSPDEGMTWTDPQFVTSARYFYPTKSGYVDGDSIHLVFERNGSGGPGTGDIYYIRSLDGGNTWGSTELLAVNDLTAYGYYFRASIVAAGSSVHVVWANHYFQPGVPGSNDSTGIFYRRSLDGGETWGPEEYLVDEANNPGRPELMAAGDVVYVGWAEEQEGAPPYMQFARAPEIYFMRSTDGGTSWEAPVRISDDLPGFSHRPELAKFGPCDNSLVLTWEDSRHDDPLEVYYSRSTDFGATWEPEQRLTFAPGLSTHPVSSGLGSLVQVTWADDRDGNLELYYKLSLDGGDNWLEDERLSFTAGATYAGRNTITADYVHVTYSDGGNNRVFYRRGSLGRGPTDPRKLHACPVSVMADEPAVPILRALAQAVISPAAVASLGGPARQPLTALGQQPAALDTPSGLSESQNGGDGEVSRAEGSSLPLAAVARRDVVVDVVFDDTDRTWGWPLVEG